MNGISVISGFVALSNSTRPFTLTFQFPSQNLSYWKVLFISARVHQTFFFLRKEKNGNGGKFGRKELELDSMQEWPG